MNATMMSVNPFGENMYILWDEASHEAVVIDPGMMREGEREMVTKFIDEHQLNVKHVLLTHLHVDHITGARWLADKMGADVCGSALDNPLGQELPDQVAHFRINIEVEPLTVDRNLSEGDTLPLGDEIIQVFSQGEQKIRLQAANIMKAIDPSQSSRYDAMLQGPSY